MKSKTLILILWLTCLTASNQMVAQQNTFTSVFYDLYGDANGYSVAETHDSSYMIAGFRDEDGLVLKMDKNGNIIWDKRFSLGTSSTMFVRIIPTHDSCFAIIGSARFETPDIVCLKITDDGDTLWSKSIDLEYWSTPVFLQETSDNGFIICGEGGNGTSNDTKMMVTKLDSLGNYEWATTINSGYKYNEAHSIRQTQDGGYIIMGSIDSFEPTFASACLIKLSPEGNISWSATLALDPPDYTSGFDAVETASGYLCLVVGSWTSMQLIFTDFSGSVLWGRDLGVGSSFGGGYITLNSKLHPTSDGAYLFASTGQWGGIHVIDSTGEMIMTSYLFLDVVDAIATSDNGFLAIGNGPLFGVILSPTLNDQVGLIKMDSLGNSTDCVYPSWIITDSCSASFIPISMDATMGAVVSEKYPIITNASLSLSSGCVAMTGSIHDDLAETRHLIVSPNPSTGTFTLTMEPENTPLSYIDIVDITGKQVYLNTQSIQLPATIDLFKLPEGIYGLRWTTSNNHGTAKLVLVK